MAITIKALYVYGGFESPELELELELFSSSELEGEELSDEEAIILVGDSGGVLIPSVESLDSPLDKIDLMEKFDWKI